MAESTLPKKRLDKSFDSEYKEMKILTKTEQYERDILNALRFMGIIGKEYTGSVIIHLNQGGISDYEKNEKGLRKRINPKG